MLFVILRSFISYSVSDIHHVYIYQYTVMFFCVIQMINLLVNDAGDKLNGRIHIFVSLLKNNVRLLKNKSSFSKQNFSFITKDTVHVVHRQKRLY